VPLGDATAAHYSDSAHARQRFECFDRCGPLRMERVPEVAVLLQAEPEIGHSSRSRGPAGLRDHDQSLAVRATHHWQRDEPRFEQRLCASLPGAG